MKNIWIAFVGLAVCLTIAASCNKTSLIGAELFENDKLNLQFTDTLSINALTDAPTSVLMSVKDASGYDNLAVGNVPDAYFGKLESAIYANFGIRNATQPTFPSLDSAVIDSVRLVMPYYAGGTYGDTTATQKLVVYRLTEELKGDTIYSDKTFSTAATALGSLTFKPTPNTTIQRIIKPLPGALTTTSDTTTLIPHVSIPLDIELGKAIMRLDSLTYKDTVMSSFQYWLKGLAIKAETPANCMMSFNMGTGTTAPTGQIARPAGIYIYYRKNKTDTTRQAYVFQTSAQTRYANYKNGYQTGKVNEFINNPKKADSLVFLQSLGGSVTRLEIPNLKNLGNVLINKAEIEFTINDDADTKIFPPLEQLLLLNGSAKISNGNYVQTSLTTYGFSGTNTRGVYDLLQGGYGSQSFAVPTDFGGTVVTENGVRKYKMNITQHLQRILNGSEGTQFYLVPYFQYTKPGRVVLYGPKHSKYRAKVNVFFTKV
jgi:Domain of unknown function (DUF4270)